MARRRRDAWIARNPEANRAAKTRWRLTHPEKQRAAKAKRDYQKNQAYTRAYRARARGNGGTHTPADVDRLLVEQSGRCAYCSAPLRRVEVDHKTPLARGGSNGPENLQLVCRTCNASKGARTHDEFLAARGA